jgi:hypothetical protein
MIHAKFLKKINTDTLNCLISGTEFNDDDYNNLKVIKLKCGHIFHYDNIIESYKITNTTGKNFINKQLCPYCLQNGGLLPFNYMNIKLKPIREIHFKNIRNSARRKKFKCCGVIKSGTKKGEICNNNCNSGKCWLSKFRPFYILTINIIENNNNNKIIINLTSKTWCGKHTNNKNKFLDNTINISKYPQKKAKYIKICYRPKFGYIFISPVDIEQYKKLLIKFYEIEDLDNFENIVYLELDTIKKQINLSNMVQFYKHQVNNHEIGIKTGYKIIIQQMLKSYIEG